MNIAGPALLVLALVAGCGSSPAPSAPSAAPAQSTRPSSASPAATPASTAAPAAMDAAGELAKLKAAGLPIGASGVVTAENDPNHLLGRPNGYTSKVYWTDTRVNQSKLYPSSVGGVEPGGSIETYSDVAGATTRRDFIAAIAKSAPVLANEYDYLFGTSVVRVSGLLTPDQAKQYEAAG